MRLLIRVCLLAILATTGCVHSRPAKIMTWKQYSRLSIKWPHILKVESAKGSLLYYGADHTRNPKDQQIAEIERLWQELHPDIAFNEGGDPPTEISIDSAVTKYGEPGLVRYLAARDKVPVSSLDPTRAEQSAFLLKKFAPEKVKLFFVLRVVAQHKQKSNAGLIEEELTRVFPIFAATANLGVAPNSIAELESSYARYFPGQGNFKDAKLSWFDPLQSENFLNEMGRRLSEYRDQYMMKLITDSVKQGRRVFAVVGGSHVVMQERAIRNLLH